jgi:hypothetical protein
MLKKPPSPVECAPTPIMVMIAPKIRIPVIMVSLLFSPELLVHSPSAS